VATLGKKERLVVYVDSTTHKYIKDDADLADISDSRMAYKILKNYYKKKLKKEEDKNKK
jgi:hypothetical protein